DPDGDLAHPRPEQAPLHADPVARVQQGEEPEEILAQVVLAEVELDAAVPIHEVREHRLAVRARGDEPAAQTDGRPEPFLQGPLLLGGLESGPRVRRGRIDLEPVGERLDTTLPQRLELLVAHADRLAQPLAAALHLSTRRIPLLRHRSPQAARAPNSFRYASMNGSRSPSITRCTSEIFSSVRWSVTIVYGWNT